MKLDNNIFRAIVIIACIFIVLPVAANTKILPASFFEFQEFVYLQSGNMTETMRFYRIAKQDIEKTLTGADFHLALSRCEYIIGLYFRAEGRANEANTFFERGIASAEKSIELHPSSEGYRILGTNVAFLCEGKLSYGIKNVGKIDDYAKLALELDSKNLTARYLIAAKYVVSPWPFGNVRKGIALLEEITAENINAMEKEDLFNLYLMLEAACHKLNRHQEAESWHLKAAALYPTNKFIEILVKL